MSYLSHTNREKLLNGFGEFFLLFFEAINNGRLEEALIIAENAMAFIAELLEREAEEFSDNANLFVFVESPQH